jgi:5-methylcytosine-specific restriction protein A
LLNQKVGPDMFVQGKVYRRRDLHSRFNGQRQGGISTPSAHNLILIFTGEQGEQYGYSDGWDSEGVFLYTGEGQHGDMQFVRGNRAILDHAQNGKDMHLFSYTSQRGFVRYSGQMVYTGHHHRLAPDLDNNMRRAVVF